MKRGQISSLLRNLGIIYYTDKARYYVMKFKRRKQKRAFIQKNPDVKLPPDYLIYEAFQLDYKKYYDDSIETAKWLTGHLSKHITLENVKILDWGCGPGRIIRHMPNFLGNGCEMYGTDYNKNSIAWCSKNIPDAKFNLNTLDAKLPYSDNFFDAIYGISIFTHLSENKHLEWYQELFRVLKPNGIMFLTTQGDNFKSKLTESELVKYSKGELVVRAKVKEGHRTFSAFHPNDYMIQLYKPASILEHIVRTPQDENDFPQDIWIIRK